MTEFDSSEKLPTASDFTFQIDPAAPLPPSGSAQVPSPSLAPTLLSNVTATRLRLEPTRDAAGLINETRQDYATQLYVLSSPSLYIFNPNLFRLGVKRKAPLQDHCRQLQLKVGSRATLTELRDALQNHWYVFTIKFRGLKSVG